MVEREPGLIHLHRNDLDTKIYRVFSIQRLLELFIQRKNTLVRPKLWDDPFENYVLESTGELETGERYRIGFKDHLYGQCWSLVRDSDALWRIYSPDFQPALTRDSITLVCLDQVLGGDHPSRSQHRT